MPTRPKSIKLYLIAVNREYFKQILSVVLIIGIFMVNMICSNQITDAVKLVRTLNQTPYRYVALHQYNKGLPNTYRYYARNIFVYTGSFIDVVADVVVLQETENGYTGADPFRYARNIVAGDGGVLRKGEVAVSQKTAEQYGLNVGDEIFTSIGGQQKSFQIQYIYQELYTIVEIDIDVKTFSVVFSSAEMFSVPQAGYLTFCQDDDMIFDKVYLKSREVQKLNKAYRTAAVGWIVVTIVLTYVAYNLINRKLYKKIRKMHRDGIKIWQIGVIEWYRLWINLIPAALLSCFIARLIGVGPLVYLLTAIEVAAGTILQGISECLRGKYAG